jgi:hypothetical protein
MFLVGQSVRTTCVERIDAPGPQQGNAEQCEDGVVQRREGRLGERFGIGGGRRPVGVRHQGVLLVVLGVVVERLVARAAEAQEFEDSLHGGGHC